ncbi:hypothetical protein [Peribacillus loiseleuriae]|uniref:hypothetical protein n=1 Tax=Peribacillus loiseleuriae TaxID=1679170 RepID=UPI003D067C43
MAHKIKINGVKFFQEHLDLLKMEHQAFPLPASAIAAYILTHFYCDDLGEIRVARKKAELDQFMISKVSASTGIPYSTLHTGFSVLFERGILSEGIRGNQQFYIIKGYERLNSPELAVAGERTRLSYFRIPYLFKETTVLRKLVSARDSKGLLMLLETFNSFHRDLWKVDSLDNLIKKRSMNYFKGLFNKSAKKVREWIENVKEFFDFTPLDYQEKMPNHDRVAISKANNPIQVLIHRFSVSITEACISKSNEGQEIRQLEASLRKEATIQFNRENVNLTKKDINDIMRAFREETIKPLQYYTVESTKTSYYIKRNQLIGQIFLVTLEEILQYYKLEITKDPLFKINSMGGLFREKVRKHSAIAYRYDLSTEHSIDMVTAAYKSGDSVAAELLRNLNQIAQKYHSKFAL